MKIRTGGIVQNLETFAESVESDSALQRRTFLGIGILAVLQAGVAAAKVRSTIAHHALGTLGCETATCYAQAAGLEVPGTDLASLPTWETTTTTSTTPEPAEPEVVPETVPEAVAQVEPESPKPEKPSPKNLPYAAFAQSAERIIAAIPTLDMVSDMFPGAIPRADVAAQKDYIAYLDDQAQVSVIDFAAYKLDHTLNTIFRGVGSYSTTIHPRFIVDHWTARYFDGPDHLARSMANSGSLRVGYYIDRDIPDTVFSLFEDDNRKGAHALSANSFSVGIEVEAMGMMDITVEQARTMVMHNVDVCMRNGWPVNEYTILGHYATDLIFANATYDANAGEFSHVNDYPPYIDKFDPPQEFIQVIVRKAKKLAFELGYQ